MKINSANVSFNDQGTPVATAFEDVYFSNQDGVAETHHVFIKGNKLLERFEQCDDAHFTIAETGFGTGLNCLVAIQVFNGFRRKNPHHPLRHLHLLTCEKYPLTKTDLQQALAPHIALQPWIDSLLQQYPIAMAGCHRLHLTHATLDIWFGDVEEVIKQWDSGPLGLVDAWFLDGFAPSKNPQMWTQSLFDLMANLSKPHTTLATFTAAGFVRRGLAQAGFAMIKSNGFGKKRDMLVGQVEAGNNSCTANLGQSARRCVSQGAHIGIIGGGLAGANAAYALASKGFMVTLFDQSSAASGASGNAQGGFYPQLHAQVSIASRIQAHSFLYAHQLYTHLAKEHEEFAHAFCGVLQLAFNDDVAQRHNKLIKNAVWPDSLVTQLSAQQTTRIAAVPLPYQALYFDKGGWISPPELVRSLLNTCVRQWECRVLEHSRVNSITCSEENVVVNSVTGSHEFDHVVIATGHDDHILQGITSLPFRQVRGQVEYIPTQTPLTDLQCVVCHKGYLTPQYNGRHSLGSTYVRQDKSTDYREQEAQLNLQTHKQAMNSTEWARTLQHDSIGRASIRMALPDHQPVVGFLAENELNNKVSVLCGLGSRGLTTAPLMAELLACKLAGSPLPLSSDLISALEPTRFALKDKQNKTANR